MEKISKKILQSLEKISDNVLATEVRVSILFLNFLGIIILRVLEEKFLASSMNTTEGLVVVFLYNFFFFSILYLLIGLFLAFFLKIKIKNISRIMPWSFWMILLPPVLDMLKTGGSVFWSFYALNSLFEMWGQFITVFGRLPSGIVYYGTKIIFIVTIALSAGFIWIRTKNILKTLIGALGIYVIIFMMGTLPSWLTMIYYFFEGSKDIRAVSGVDIIQFFSRPYPIFGVDGYGIKYAFTTNLNMFYFWLLLSLLGGIFFLADRAAFLAVLKNSRLPQLLYHLGLLLVGFGLGFLAYPQNMQLNLFSLLAIGIIIASIFMAWKSSVIVNDLYDYDVDCITNIDRPLQKNIFTKKQYMDLGIVLFGLSLLGGIVISVKFALLFLIYQILAWFYSAPPYRLKRFPIIATFFSALASIVILMIGFNLFSGDDNMKLFPWKIIGLLLAGLTLSLPIKDFKDIEGDRKDGVWTIPVLFGENIGRIIVASGIFISYMLSVFVLNEASLFWPALFSGGASFWIITNKKIKPRRFNWWALGVLIIYTAILIPAVFL